MAIIYLNKYFYSRQVPSSRLNLLFCIQVQFPEKVQCYLHLWWFKAKTILFFKHKISHCFFSLLLSESLCLFLTLEKWRIQNWWEKSTFFKYFFQVFSFLFSISLVSSFCGDEDILKYVTDWRENLHLKPWTPQNLTRF